MDRRKALISSAVAIVVLAAVIFGLSAIGPSRTPDPVPSSTTITDAQRADAFAEQSQAALASGDASQAVTLATQALAIDGTNAVATRVLRTVTGKAATPDSGTNPNQGGSSSANTTTPINDPFAAKVSSLVLLLPTAPAGFQLGAPATMGSDASVSGTPQRSGASVSLIVWTVRDAQSAAAASSFVSKTSKSAYASDAADMTVDGIPGYFGTDGTRYAAVSYVRGRHVFEVVVTSTGPAPNTLRQIALQAAEAFPDRVP